MKIITSNFIHFFFCCFSTNTFSRLLALKNFFQLKCVCLQPIIASTPDTPTEFIFHNNSPLAWTSCQMHTQFNSINTWMWKSHIVCVVTFLRWMFFFVLVNGTIASEFQHFFSLLSLFNSNVGTFICNIETITLCTFESAQN